MEKITSFTIDHIKLQPGLYVSRKDKVGAETVTTFDLRLTKPNDEPVMNTAEVHTIEHLAATYLRNEPNWKDKVLYFGPMGCRTGFYLILTGDLTSREIVPLVRDCFRFCLANLFLILVRNIGLLSMDAVTDIGFVLQNIFDLPYRPGMGFFLVGILIDVGEGSVWNPFSRAYFCKMVRWVSMLTLSPKFSSSRLNL